MPQFPVYDQYNFCFTDHFDDTEPSGGECLVDTIGYEPFEAQLQDIFNAGEQLRAYMAAMYPQQPNPTASVPEIDVFDRHPEPVYMDTLDALDALTDLASRGEPIQTSSNTTSAEASAEVAGASPTQGENKAETP